MLRGEEGTARAVLPQPPSPLVGMQPVTASEADEPGARPRALRRCWARAPVFTPSLPCFSCLRPPAEFCSNYKWFDNFRQGPVIKNKEEDNHHCLLTDF